jgi:hypothetical protein
MIRQVYEMLAVRGTADIVFWAGLRR